MILEDQLSLIEDPLSKNKISTFLTMDINIYI